MLSIGIHILAASNLMSNTKYSIAQTVIILHRRETVWILEVRIKKFSVVRSYSQLPYPPSTWKN